MPRKSNNLMEKPYRNPDGGLIDAYDELGTLIMRTYHWLYVMYNGHIGQQKIISILANMDSMSQKDLQNVLDIKPSSASEIITKLEDKGDIVRTRDEKDRRKVVLKITEAGRLKNKYLQDHQKNNAEPQIGFDVLTAQEQETLKQLLRKLTPDSSN